MSSKLCLVFLEVGVKSVPQPRLFSDVAILWSLGHSSITDKEEKITLHQ